jgi:beta-galactosidase GanA
MRKLIVLALLFLPSAAPAPFVPVGVWYGGGKARAPMLVRNPAPERDAWRRDLDQIKRLGFNSIKCWVDWATSEPRRGEYHFEALDQLLGLADEAGLRVIVQFYTDSQPEWIGRAYADASFVTDQGARIGSQASPGFCLDHAGVREAMTRFIAAASARARQHPSLYGFDVWSEPHLVNWVWFNSNPEFCYCAYTQAKFRDWLRQKYGSLDALNAAWYRTFERWEDVEAPRFGTILSYTDFIDWKTFVAAKLRDDLRAKADATGARGAVPIGSHSDAPAVLLSPLSGYGNPDDWSMTGVVDHYGTSIYPRHASSAAPWSPVRLMSALDGIRSAARGRGWWIGELQAGQGATGVRVGTPVTAADVRLWGWAAISRGAQAISYYAYYPMSSGYESNGYGLIELDGGVTDRARAAGAFARAVTNEATVFAAAKPRPAQVAVLYNRLAYMVGGNTVGPGNTVRNSMIGFYRAMFERNIAVDFVHTDDLVSGAAPRYRAIYLGTPLMLPAAAAAALKAYVEQGGVLISEARPAWNDERGFANQRIPGGGLDEVFGVREGELRSSDTVSMTMTRDLPAGLSALAGTAVPGATFAEHLLPIRDGVRVLATFDDPSGAAAITEARFGSGRAILIGSFPAAAFEQDPTKMRNAGTLLQALVEDAGIRPEVRVGGAAGLVDARLLDVPSGLVLIAINHDDAPQRVTLTLPPRVPAGSWRNVENGSSVSFSATADGPTLTHQFSARDVLVLIHEL